MTRWLSWPRRARMHGLWGRSSAATARPTALVMGALLVAACSSAASPSAVPTTISPASASVPAATTLATTLPTTLRPVPAGRIAFGTKVPALDDFLIYTARPDGSDVTQLLPDAHQCPIWSPDGTEIAVTGGTGGAFATVVHADGTNARVLKLAEANVQLGCGAWSPDGKQLALEGWNDKQAGAEGIYVVGASDGAALTRLTSPKGGVHDSPVSFSPDGKRILFLHNSNPDTNAETGELWVSDADGSNPQRVGDQYVAQGAAFSPDGRWIAAVAGRVVLVFDAGDFTAPPNQIELPGMLAGNGVNWSPDGSRWVLGLFRPGVSRPNIFTIKVDGTDLWHVTKTTEESTFGSWGLPPV